MKQVENKRQFILLGILIVLVIFYFIDSSSSTSKKIQTPASSLAKAMAGNESVSELDDIHSIIESASIVELSWDKDWEKDPFFYVSPESLNVKSKNGLIDNIFGQVSEVAKSTSLSLTGISWHGNSGFAIINGQIVKLDDVISGYKVDKIALNHVVLKQGLKTVRLTLDDQ